ncbi:hypothetical protein CSIM01_08471 [Colletotrichum simmondsii]|uniref:Uncharacterized protein n=1 Tax=Colletotrichum simmondsii TaxID=703756 RepID=A0A135SI21_9PEZI|nr:hypothetical protein CSIM01_08471 [Colletotrichum simmondsii]
MAPSPLHSLPSPTTTFKPILAAFTQPPTATPTTLITTVAKLVPRTATTVSVYITQVPSATAAPDTPKLKDPVYGNLTWTFIVVPCVPVIVLIFFIFTCYQERRRAIKNMKKNPDIEMQTFHKFWFPWRELDKNEVPNEVSQSKTSPSSSHITPLPPGARDDGPGDAAAATASTSTPAPSGSTSPGILILGEHPRRKKRRWTAWHPSDGTQIPPITLYENPPSWGRRHLWSEVMAYPSLLNPGLIRRRNKTPTNTKPDPADDTSSSSSYSSPPSPNASPPRLTSPRTAPPRTSPPRTPGGLPVIAETEPDEGDIATARRRPRFAEPTTRIVEPESEHGPGRDTNPYPSQIYGRTGRRRHSGHEDDHPREGQRSSSSENQTDTSDGDTNNGSDNDEGIHSDADSITTQKPLRPPTDIPSFGRFKDISSSTGTGTSKSTAAATTTTTASSGTGTWAAGHIPSYYGASPSPAHTHVHQQQPSSSASASTTRTPTAAAAAGAAALSRRAHAYSAASRASAANSDGVSPLSSARSSTVTVTGDARRRTANTVSSIGSEPGSPTRFGSLEWRSALVEASSSSSAVAGTALPAEIDGTVTKANSRSNGKGKAKEETKPKDKGKGKAKAQPRSRGAKTDTITAKAKPKCTCKSKGKGKAIAASGGAESSTSASASASASSSSSSCPRHPHQSHNAAVVEASQSTPAAPDTRDPARKNENKAHRRSITEWPRVCSGCGQVG